MNTTPLSTQDTHRRIRLLMELRTKGITDMDVLGAMERVPREEFVPAEVVDQAWEDMALPIGLGQTISQPFVVASMTAALGITKRDTVLEIGTGCGYQAAVLSKLCRRVYTIERHRPLHDIAVERLESLGITNITALCGDGMKGWLHAGFSFDSIIVTAAARDKAPQALLDQLKIGGKLCIPIGESGFQKLKLFTKESDEAYAVRDLMDVRFVPLLPDIADT